MVVIKELSETDKILTALKNDGINTAEITFRTACAAEVFAKRRKGKTISEEESKIFKSYLTYFLFKLYGKYDVAKM